MIDWHHPRVFERFRCFGLTLFTLGIASHNTDAPVIAVSALAISVLLLYRLKLELEIRRDDDGERLDTAMHKINRVNEWTLVPVLVGAFGVMRRLSDG
jgi:hypothetical protein